MTIGQVIDIRYDAGEFSITQGHKRGERGHYTKSGYYVNPIGFGNATICRGSKLILDVEVDGIKYAVWIDRFFKDNWGKLTAKRRYAIEQTAPSTVFLNEQKACSGSVYYTVHEQDMIAWLDRAMKVS